jgi:hypothetical protein
MPACSVMDQNTIVTSSNSVGESEGLMALDGLKMDGAGGIVQDDEIANSFGMSLCDMQELERDILKITLDDVAQSHRLEIAKILVAHLTHEERMCALHTFYQADVAPCSGEVLCQLQKRVLKKLQLVPELKSLWHLL